MLNFKYTCFLCPNKGWGKFG